MRKKDWKCWIQLRHLCVWCATSFIWTAGRCSAVHENTFNIRQGIMRDPPYTSRQIADLFNSFLQFLSSAGSTWVDRKYICVEDREGTLPLVLLNAINDNLCDLKPRKTMFWEKKQRWKVEGRLERTSVLGFGSQSFALFASSRYLVYGLQMKRSSTFLLLSVQFIFRRIIYQLMSFCMVRTTWFFSISSMCALGCMKVVCTVPWIVVHS